MEIKKPQQQLQQQLFRSHLSIASLGFIVLIISLIGTWFLGTNAARLATEIGPTAQATLRVLNGIHHSNAAIRGWVALGDKEFIVERKFSWDNEIFPAIKELNSRVEQTAIASEIIEIQKVIKLLKELQESQWWIEDVAQTPGNDRARYFFTKDITPVTNTLMNAISGMIFLTPLSSSDLTNNDQLQQLNRFQYHLAQSNVALERFLDTSEPHYIISHNDHLQSLKDYIYKIEDIQTTFGIDRLDLLTQIKNELPIYETLVLKLFKIRAEPEWNVARHGLRTEAVPLARNIISRLGTMSTRHAAKMHQQADSIERVIFILIIIATLLIIFIVITAISLAKYNANRLIQPIHTLSNAAKLLASGSLEHDIELDDIDELSTLTNSFNHMRHSVQEKTKQLEHANKELKMLSETDPLTEIPNRLFYNQRISFDIANAKRNNKPLSLLIVDVDFFKIYNDNYGHDNGDIVLQRVAECISKTLTRTTDSVSRIGGEEFTVLLPITDKQGAFNIAERIRSNISDLAIPHETTLRNISVSIGIASLTGSDLNKELLFKQADNALYTAKEQGRNQSYIYTTNN